MGASDIASRLSGGNLFGQVFQDPVLDVIKQMNNGNHSPRVEGQVRQVLDKTFGCHIFELVGLVPAANYVQVPGRSSDSLGLPGPYVYIQIRRANPDRHFAIHFDLQTTSAHLVVRISFSNLFKDIKFSGRVVQIPLTQLHPLKWTVFAADLKTLLSAYTSYDFLELKSIQICAEMQFRGIYVSSKIYTPGTMPREMRMPLLVKDEWMSVYDWLWSPRSPSVVLEQPGARLVHSNNATAMDNFLDTTIDKLQLDPEQGRTTGAMSEQLHPIQPDPIIDLEHIVGFNGDVVACLKWNKKDCIIYSSMDVIINHNMATDSQVIMSGHTSQVSVLSICPFGRLLVSGQSGRQSFVILWELATCQVLCRLPAFANGVVSVSISCDARLLVCVGSDGHTRVQIAVWDISNVFEKGTATIIAKQTSEFGINEVVFNPHPGCQHQLASCGPENIRFWRIKNGHLPGHSLVLNEHSRNTFNTLSFEPIFGSGTTMGSHPHLLYVASASGSVFVIDLESNNLRFVYQLHKASISAMVVTQGFCITGSDDRYLRVWPMDFSDWVTEAQHESAVTSLTISENGLSVIAGTSAGTIGILDVTDSTYRTYLRSHTSNIFALCLSPNMDEFVTTSGDGTVRIWAFPSKQQLYEFKTPHENAVCVAYHPLQSHLALGFPSGKIHIVDIATQLLLVECCHHTASIRKLIFTPDGRRLFSGSNDHHICAFDVLRLYQPVRLLGASFTDQVSMDIHPNGSLLAASGPMGSNEVIIYDVDSFSERQRFTLKTGGCHLVAFHPQGSEILIATTTRSLIRYDFNACCVVGETSSGKEDSISLCVIILTSFAYANTTRSVKRAPPSSVRISRRGNSIRFWKFYGLDNHLIPIISKSADRSESRLTSRVSPSISHIKNSVSPIPKRPSTRNCKEIPAAQRRLSIPNDEALVEKPIPNLHVQYRPSKAAASATIVYIVPPDESAMQLQQVLNCNGKARNNVIWNPTNGLFCFSTGKIIVVENLVNNQQQFLRSHLEDVSTMALSDDGDLLVSAEGVGSGSECAFSMINLWCSATLKQICQILSPHRSGVQTVAFNSSTTHIVSVGCADDPTLCVWSVATGKCMAYHRTETRSVVAINCAKWIPGSNDQFITCSNSRVECWRLTQSAIRRNEDEEEETTVNRVHSYPFTLTGSMLTGNPSAQHEGSQTCFSAIGFIDRHHLLIGTSIGTILIWKMGPVSAFDFIGDLKCFPSEINTMAIVSVGSNDEVSAKVVMAGTSDTIREWRIDIHGSTVRARECDCFQLGEGNCIAACWDSVVEVGVIGIDNGTILHVKLQNSLIAVNPTRLASGHNSRINEIAFGPYNDELMCSCGDDGSVRLWHVQTGFKRKPDRYDQIMYYQVPNQNCACIQFSPTGSIVAAGYSDKSVRFLDIHNLAVIHKMELPNSAERLTYINNGGVLIAASSEGQLYFISCSTFEIIFIANNHASYAMNSIARSPHDETMFLACDTQLQISIWNVQLLDSNRCNATLYRWINPQRPSMDHQKATAIDGHDLAVFDVVAPECILWCVCSADPIIVVYNYETEQLLRSISLPHVPLCMSITSHSGCVVAVGAQDCTLTLVDCDTGAYQDMVVHSDRVENVMFSHSGNKLVSSSNATIVAHRFTAR